jgi:ribulose-phosphate 3-epimerase
MSHQTAVQDDNMVLISPSILAIEKASLCDASMMAEKGGADWIHLDIMDGHFVPNLTYGPPVVRLCRESTKLPLDAHLMVTNPDDLIPELLDIGCEYITVHQETCVHLHRTLMSIRDGGAKSGVALNPATPAVLIMDILPIIDMVVIMAVNPGFAGQKHIPESAGKVARFNEKARNMGWEGLVQVDGGVNTKTAGDLVLAGADCLVAGAAVFKRRGKAKAGDIEAYTKEVEKNIEDLHTACQVAIETGLDPYK